MIDNPFFFGSFTLSALAVGDLFSFSIPAPIAIDIKPQGCPNPLKTKSKGVTPVAVLRTSDFDVTVVDIASLRLGGVAAIRSSVEDVATPFTLINGLDDAYHCHDLGPDSEVRVLTLTGVLEHGTPIEGQDVVVIKAKGRRNY
jgi:hypothetical protein